VARPAGRRERAHGIAAKLRLRSAPGRDEAQATVQRFTGELAELAELADHAEKLLANARRALRRAQATSEAVAVGGGKDAAAGRRRGRLRRVVNDLTELLEVTRPVATQTRQRVAGTTPAGATRRVSLHDPDARPIAKGQLGKPVQLGYKAQVVDNQDGIVLDHNLEQCNPPDAPQLAPQSERVIKRTGRKPRTATADRGYGENNVDDALRDLGVRHVVIPRKGKPGKARQAEDTGRVPQNREVANRQRGPDQQPQTRIRLGPHPPGRHRRSPDLDRTGSVRPQPGQDRSPDQLGGPGRQTDLSRIGRRRRTDLNPATFAGRSSRRQPDRPDRTSLSSNGDLARIHRPAWGGRRVVTHECPVQRECGLRRLQTQLTEGHPWDASLPWRHRHVR